MPTLPAIDGFNHFRRHARALLAGDVAPEAVSWQDGAQAQLAFPAAPRAGESERIAIPRDLYLLLEEAACHCDPQRWAAMYRLLWRVQRGAGKGLLADAADPDVCRVRQYARTVCREVHKMHAFVRFREQRLDGGQALWSAWFEPRHYIVQRAAPFFVDRFASMRWIIVTPELAAKWDGAALTFIAGPHAARRQSSDPGEALWRTYYAAIFNPARSNERLMTKEVPRRYWHNLPELRNVEALTHEAAQRVAAMQTASVVVPRWAQRAAPQAPLPAHDLQQCRRCDLWLRATQAVPGEGPAPAKLMLVGEQPGEEEDLQGRPFVGPAGEVLGRALAKAGIARTDVYLTNAVKHFKWEPRGKRRLHKTPAQREIALCNGWLQAEIARVAPKVVVALGTTAALATAGSRLPIAQSRGRTLEARNGARLIVTYHPSAVLRAEQASSQLFFEALSADLARADALSREAES